VSNDGRPGPELSRRLGYLLKHAQQELTELTTKALAPFGIDGRDLGVLLVLGGREPASQLQVAQLLGVDRTTMVTLLDTLEDKGLVSRHPDAEDRRRNVVELTGTGRDALRRATRASDEAERAFLAPLSSQDGEHLRNSLHGHRDPSGPQELLKFQLTRLRDR
jgi:DNA-binding MarR family transcriptional regulator